MSSKYNETEIWRFSNGWCDVIFIEWVIRVFYPWQHRCGLIEHGIRERCSVIKLIFNCPKNTNHHWFKTSRRDFKGIPDNRRMIIVLRTSSVNLMNTGKFLCSVRMIPYTDCVYQLSVDMKNREWQQSKIYKQNSKSVFGSTSTWNTLLAIKHLWLHSNGKITVVTRAKCQEVNAAEYRWFWKILARWMAKTIDLSTLINLILSKGEEIDCWVLHFVLFHILKV